MTKFKTEKTYLMIKTDSGLKHIKANVEYSYCYEEEAPDFDYGNEEENKAEMRRFESGELLNLILSVEVSALGEEGRDVLGQVFVKSKTAEDDLIQTAIEHDMKNNAAKECIEAITAKYKTLQEALK